LTDCVIIILTSGIDACYAALRSLRISGHIFPEYIVSRQRPDWYFEEYAARWPEHSCCDYMTKMFLVDRNELGVRWGMTQITHVPC